MRNAAIAAAVTVGLLVPGLPAAVAEEDAGGLTEVAIYQNDLALVSISRPVELEQGRARLAIDRISPEIISSSLSISGEDLTVVEQSLLPWPLDRAALLRAYLGHTVTLVREREDEPEPERREATLLAIENGLVLQVGDEIEVDPPGRIVFPGLPPELSPTARAMVTLDASSAGQRSLDISYLTRGLSWDLGYLARYDEAEGTLSLSGLAEIKSSLPIAFGAGGVRLVAGEVPVEPAEQGQRERKLMMAMSRAESAESADAGVSAPASRGDLKLYELSRELDLAAGSAVQVPLIRQQTLSVEPEYRLEGLATAHPVGGERGPVAAQLRLEVSDTRAAGLEVPLPAGVMRVYAGSLYRGARRIDDVPVGGRLTLELGSAFDITATARQTGFEQLGNRTYETAQEIELRNAKPRPVTVHVVGAFPPEWKMIEESHPHQATMPTQPRWTVEIPATGTATLSYRLRVMR